jgi:hypothetical protein
MRTSWWGLALIVACGSGGDDDDDGGGVYQDCVDAEQCEAPEGFEPACLEKGDEGFCTATCDVDDDCGDADFVCASFESDVDTYCFPSCEGDEDSCPRGFGCRSTGGGVDNRKVCFPETL